MFARMTLLLLAGALTSGAVARPAFAADFGISFHYSSSSSRYYSTWAVPRDYVDYIDYWDYDDPPVYISYSTPRVAVYDTCRPVTYRTTYSRSYSYRRPVRHSRVAVYYASGHRGHHYRHRATYQRHYSRSRPSSRSRYLHSGSRYRYDHARPRPSSRTYDRHSRSHYRSSDSLRRQSGSRDRHSYSHRRHDLPRRRGRVYRR